MKENAIKRLTEVITSYTINRICNYVNRKKYKEHITILQNLVTSIDPEYKEKFEDLFTKSYNEKILGASRKEIYGAMKFRYEKNRDIAKKLGLSMYKFNNSYKDLASRDFMNDEWFDSLVPICDDKTYEMCKAINTFVDNFNYLAGEPYYRGYDLFRSIELEFYIIHMTLLNILGSSSVVEKFLFNVCTGLDIDWGNISYLLRNVNIISRNNDIQMNGNRQLKQEIFNLMYLKGFSKADVGEVIFHKDRKVYYSGSYNYLTEDITKDEYEFSVTYVPTLDWEALDKDEVLKFIDVFRSFSNEQL